jgi:hypothetical protein
MSKPKGKLNVLYFKKSLQKYTFQLKVKHLGRSTTKKKKKDYNYFLTIPKR